MEIIALLKAKFHTSPDKFPSKSVMSHQVNTAQVDKTQLWTHVCIRDSQHSGKLIACTRKSQHSGELDWMHQRYSTVCWTRLYAPEVANTVANSMHAPQIVNTVVNSKYAPEIVNIVGN